MHVLHRSVESATQSGHPIKQLLMLTVLIAFVPIIDTPSTVLPNTQSPNLNFILIHANKFMISTFSILTLETDTVRNWLLHPASFRLTNHPTSLLEMG